MMSSRDRIMTALGFQEPDRVPLVLNPTMHAAKDLGIRHADFFTSSDHVARGQLHIREKYGTDAYFGFHYGAVDFEAFGGSILFREDGPPNSGRPIITSGAAIDTITVPRVHETACLAMVLETIRLIKAGSPDDAPIFGVVIAPLSLPVMQMGFEAYLQLMYTDPERFDRLIAINSEFCIAWGKAQIAAGADAIIYFDPVSSPMIIPPALYERTGWRVAREVIPQIPGPVATAFASARVLPILDRVIETGTAAIAFGESENISEIKALAGGKVGIIGNLNGIAMVHWSREEVADQVSRLIRIAAPGGGFILSDNHGEIPLQVPDENLLAIREAATRFGSYPIVT